MSNGQIPVGDESMVVGGSAGGRLDNFEPQSATAEL
jgi:hypothetical protein